MKTEFECRFLDTNIEEMRRKLQDLGYKCEKPEFLMRRLVFNLPETDDYKHWIRLRDEGDEITITHKSKSKGDKDIASLKETMTSVGNFDEMKEFLLSIGFVHLPLQENRREMWTKGDIEVCIDTWPGLKTYTEIESTSEEKVRNAAQELGFQWDEAMFGNVSEVYKKTLGLTRDEWEPFCCFAASQWS
jgi:predicted adenylyl cyclase CyaB